MELLVFPTHKALSEKAAGFVRERIASLPRPFVLGCATGSTPLGLYGELALMHERGAVDFSRVTFFNLDEYCGLDAGHPQSYRFYMREHLFSKVSVNAKNTHFPLCAEEMCRAFEEAIRAAGGIDLQVLGIGRNGHIGFNEPGSAFDSRTRVVELSEETIADNARFFDSPADVPRSAATMGLGTIMEAREVLLLASGAHKAEILHRALTGPVTESVPASILQNHPRLTVILGKEADRFWRRNPSSP